MEWVPIQTSWWLRQKPTLRRSISSTAVQSGYPRRDECQRQVREAHWSLVVGRYLSTVMQHIDLAYLFTIHYTALLPLALRAAWRVASCPV